MVRDVDLGWLAGLVEGEGCISWNEGGDRLYGTAQIQVAMADRDVVAKGALILGSNLCGPYDRGPGNREQWATSIGGAKAAAWLMTLYPLLGERRQSRAREVLAKWRAKGPTRGKYSERCVRGHKYDGHNGKQRTCSMCTRERHPRPRAEAWETQGEARVSPIER